MDRYDPKKKEFRQQFGDPELEAWIDKLQAEDEKEETDEPMEAEESRYIDKANARAINRKIG